MAKAAVASVEGFMTRLLSTYSLSSWGNRSSPQNQFGQSKGVKSQFIGWLICQLINLPCKQVAKGWIPEAGEGFPQVLVLAQMPRIGCTAAFHISAPALGPSPALLVAQDWWQTLVNLV